MFQRIWDYPQFCESSQKTIPFKSFLLVRYFQELEFTNSSIQVFSRHNMELIFKPSVHSQQVHCGSPFLSKVNLSTLHFQSLSRDLSDRHCYRRLIPRWQFCFFLNNRFNNITRKIIFIRPPIFFGKLSKPWDPQCRWKRNERFQVVERQFWSASNGDWLFFDRSIFWPFKCCQRELMVIQIAFAP
jgi:hypothetical protein